MSDTSFSFHFLPEEDRIALTFSRDEGEVPAPVLLTRRLVKLLGNYLRHYVEKNTNLPDTVCTENKEDIYQFMHHSELETNYPQWDSGNKKQEKAKELKSARLASKVDINHTAEAVSLMFYKQDTHLVSLTLGWKQIHSFLYSLAEMSRKAEWNLENIFEWSGKPLDIQNLGQSQ